MAIHKATTSLYGRRFGLQQVSSGISGVGGEKVDFLVGGRFGGVRQEVQAATSDTTGTVIPGWGLTTVDTSTDDGWLLGPPIPGVRKTLYTGSTSTGIRTIKRQDATFAIRTSASSSMTTILAQGGGIKLELMGITTAIYGLMSTHASTEISLNGTT